MALTITKFSATPERLVYIVEGSDAANPATKTNAQLIADTVAGPLRDFLTSFTLSGSSQAAFSQAIQLSGVTSGGPNAASPAFSTAPRPDAGMSGPIAIDVYQKVAPGMGENPASLILSIQYLHSIIR